MDLPLVITQPPRAALGEVPGQPGLICVLQQQAGNPGILKVEPDWNTVQEFKVGTNYGHGLHQTSRYWSFCPAGGGENQSDHFL